MTERRNPESLHEAAAGWRDMGKHLDGLVRGLDRHVGDATSANWHGPAGEAFAADWHRLKRSVEDSLPAFELAAAELETAAAAPAAGSGDGADHGAPPVDDSAQGTRSSGTDAAYGFMALGQLASSLGGAFGRRGGGGGQGQRPPVRQEWADSTAPQGPDPFGPPGADAAKGAGPRGGEGIAKGVRTGPPGTDPAAGQDQAAGQRRTGPPEQRARPERTAAADGAASTPPDAAGPRGGSAAAEGSGPDVGRHGAFG